MILRNGLQFSYIVIEVNDKIEKLVSVDHE
jgi:hypothetical protein